jgi:hypothetical protein
MSEDQNNYLRLTNECDKLMKNTRLSLYEEVEIIREKACKAQADGPVLNELASNLSGLIERLSSREKEIYVSNCEDAKGIALWSETEP